MRSFSRPTCVVALAVAVLLQGSSKVWAKAKAGHQRAGQAASVDPPTPALDNTSANELIQEDLSLAELMNMKLSLPTRVEQQADEAPSVVSVISRKDIEAYGARDMVDILRLVPGFEFGTDVLGMQGAGQRGIWGHEGKILVMVNGITVNDLSYGNVNYFGSFPASMIERVEIIRGPGSAVYGGFAEVAVINIITREVNGISVNAGAGMLGKEPTWSGNLTAGTSFKDLKLQLNIGRTSQVLSTRPYRDFSDQEVSMGRPAGGRDWFHLTVDAVYKNALKLHFLNTNFDFGGPEGFGQITPAPPYDDRSNHRLFGLSGSYTATLTEQLSLEPSFEILEGNDGIGALSPAPGNEFSAPYVDIHRYRGELAGHYKLPNKGLVTLGGGYQQDRFSQISASGEPGVELTDGTLKYRTHTDSRFVYGQYLQTFAPFGLTLGGRYEDTSFGNAFAPRAGLVINQNKISTKLLYGRAFRIPLPFQAYSRITNRAEGGVRPETSDTVEAQMAYAFSRNLKARLNGFFTRIEQPITYIGSTNAYENFGEITALGSEFELEMRFERYGGFFNGAFSRPGPRTSDGFITVDRLYFLGMPPWKFSAGGYYNFGKLQIAPSLILLSARFGQSQESARSEDYHLGSSSNPPLLLANLAVTYRELLPNTALQLSAHNCFNAPYTLLQPYYGGHAPLPAGDREIRLTAQVTY